MKGAKGKGAAKRDTLKPVDDKKVGKRKAPAKAAGKSKAKAVKDPNKPKRTPSAFFVFLEEFRKTFKKENPTVKAVSAVGKAGGEKWKSLTPAEKAPYEAKAAKRKSDYEKMAARRAQAARRDKRLATLVTESMAAVIPNLMQQLQEVNRNQNAVPAVVQPRCTMKHFNSCNPPKFQGTEGATGLLQWFEGIENTFLYSDCPVNLRVRYAASVLQKRALTWWNGEKRTRGSAEALALPWEDFRTLMTEEFCPRNEIRKLEHEFWDLAQVGGEHTAYTTRFQELSILVPHMVTPLGRAIEKYIDGLPMPIQDTVLGSRPTTLEDAIRLAAQLTDNHVKVGTLARKGNKFDKNTNTTELATVEPLSSKSVVQAEPSSSKKKRKAKNYAVATPATPINQIPAVNQPPHKKPYNGPHPLCSTCQFHHPTQYPCRKCTTCGRYGHFATTCRMPTQNNQPPQVNQIPQNRAIAYKPACFICGDLNHFATQCPTRNNNAAPAARGRVFNVNAIEAPTNNDAANGA